MTERILVAELTGIKKVRKDDGKVPIYELIFSCPSNPVRIKELELGMQCAIGYEVLL